MLSTLGRQGGREVGKEIWRDGRRRKKERERKGGGERKRGR